jgi:hypothetical protein
VRRRADGARISVPPVTLRSYDFVFLVSPHSANAHRSWSFLPGTVTRVEPYVTHRKQTVDHLSARNVPAHSLHGFLGGFAHGVA